MRRFRVPAQAVAALAVGFGLVGSVAPAFSQPANQRTPNLEGTWVAPGGTAFFAFLHRFSVSAAPAYAVDNLPTFHLSAGAWDWLSFGTLYATQTNTVPGASQEMELFAKQRFWNEEGGSPLSLSLKEAFNLTAFSPDLELSAQRHFGPLGLTGVLRGMGNYRYSGAWRAVGALGLSWQVTPYLSLAGDVGASPQRLPTEAPVLWGAGLQMVIPYSPHTLSLQVTNTGTDTIQGSSVGVNDIRYGFDFTIPLGNAQQWLDIFRPAAAPASEQIGPTESEAPEAMPSAPASEAPAPAPSGAVHPSAAPTPQATARPAVSAKAAKFFAAQCAACHGAAGQGGFGPSLKGAEAKGDAFIAQRILKGSPKGMPPFEGRLSATELKDLVTYVKGL